MGRQHKGAPPPHEVERKNVCWGTGGTKMRRNCEGKITRVTGTSGSYAPASPTLLSRAGWKKTRLTLCHLITFNPVREAEEPSSYFRCP